MITDYECKLLVLKHLMAHHRADSFDGIYEALLHIDSEKELHRILDQLLKDGDKQWIVKVEGTSVYMCTDSGVKYLQSL